VPCVPNSKQEALHLPLNFIPYVLKFVLHVPMNALNMHNTIKVARLALMFVKNALKFAQNILPNILIK
jgi:hypothetical protein